MNHIKRINEEKTNRITRTYEITVEFEKIDGVVPYTYEELIHYADQFPERLVKYQRNKNETLFLRIIDCHPLTAGWED
jgi:hypothetical protein